MLLKNAANIGAGSADTHLPKDQYFFPSLCLRTSQKNWCTRSLMTPCSSCCCRYSVFVGLSGDGLLRPQQKASFAEHIRNMVKPWLFLSPCVCSPGRRRSTGQEQSAWGARDHKCYNRSGNRGMGGVCVWKRGMGVGGEWGSCSLEDSYLRGKGSLGTEIWPLFDLVSLLQLLSHTGRKHFSCPHIPVQESCVC